MGYWRRTRSCGRWWYRRGRRRGDEATEAATGTNCEAETARGRPHRISWARPLKRVFAIDMRHCSNCGTGQLEIVAAILERPVIEKILTHLGLQARAPPRAAARVHMQQAA